VHKSPRCAVPNAFTSYYTFIMLLADYFRFQLNDKMRVRSHRDIDYSTVQPT
jgi:hypothetical protein